MSLGYTGLCRKVSENEETVIYSYAGENWNDNGKSNSGDSLLQDGVIIIYKRCLEEPEIHTKRKRMPSGKKKTVVKRIIHTPSICLHIENGDIIIQKECKNAFKRNENMPLEYIAYMLLNHIFEEYQKSGVLPDKGAFIQ